MDKPMWQIKKTNDEGNVYHDGSTEIFKSGKWAFLTREVIQNSMDALNDYDGKLKIDFELFDIPISDVPDVESLKKHINGTLSIKGLPNNCMQFSQNAIKLLSDNSIRVLKISDYNTKGVLGSDNLKDPSSQWKALIYDEGNSQKSSDIAAGSFGLGKNAPVALSSLNTVFYVTKDLRGHYAMGGVARLHTSYIDLEKKERKIYFAKMEDNRTLPLNEDDKGYLPKIFDRKEQGTDIIILGVEHDKIQIKKEMIQSVIENFFVRILNDKLNVRIFEEEINKENIMKMIDEYCNDSIEYGNTNLKYGYVKQYVNTFLENYETKTFEHNLEGIGALKLIVSKDKEVKGKNIAVFRSHGMKIFDKQYRKSEQNFSAIFIPMDNDVDSFLRSIENPTHDHFDPEIRIMNKTERKAAANKYKRIINWIKSTIYDYTKLEVTEESFLDGMEEYIELDDSDSTEPKDIKKPDIGIIEYKPKSGNHPMKPETFERDPKEIDSFDPDDGVSAEKSKKAPNVTGEKAGKDKRGFKVEYHTKFKTPPKINSLNNNIKVGLSLDEYKYNNFNIEIMPVGEDNSVSNELPSIIDVQDMNTGEKIDFYDNKIIGIPVSNVNPLDIKLSREFVSRYKIIVYREVDINEN